MMFSLLQGWGMMGGSSGNYYGHMRPLMMGFGGYSANPVFEILAIAFSVFIHALIIIALISVIRFFWKKSDHKCCQDNHEDHK